MNIADRIQGLRKAKGISQEDLADIIGVSRQAVSKWESEQSLPDIEKIILMSDHFNVTTDYILKGVELPRDRPEKKVDARIFSAVGSALDFIGLTTAILVWIEEQTQMSVAAGLMLMAFGCMIFAIGQFIGEGSKKASVYFWIANIWFLSLIPISCAFNCIQGILGGHWWAFAPIPQLENSIGVYGMCWLTWFIFCVAVDIAILRRGRKGERNA